MADDRPLDIREQLARIDRILADHYRKPQGQFDENDKRAMIVVGGFGFTLFVAGMAFALFILR